MRLVIAAVLQLDTDQDKLPVISIDNIEEATRRRVNTSTVSEEWQRKALKP